MRRTAWCWSCARTSPGTRRRRGWGSQSHRSVGGAAASTVPPIRDGLIVAVLRHYESRAGKPLLHDHAVVSIRARWPDDKGRGATCRRTRCWSTSSPPAPSTPCTSWRRCPPGSDGRGSRAR
ncbi:relaxase domain-containing protein [Streptomyces sp. NPDC091412]|uniref:relaxase domain-containing protein n=1 Tax=Streptomyces sp. NPDC091412 TaxID=3366002 RepID=UPI0037FD5B4E